MIRRFSSKSILFRNMPMSIQQQQRQPQQCQMLLNRSFYHSVSSSSTTASCPSLLTQSRTISSTTSTLLSSSSSSTSSLSNDGSATIPSLVAVLQQSIAKEKDDTIRNEMEQLVSLLQESNITSDEETQNNDITNVASNLTKSLRHHKELYVSPYEEIYDKIKLNRISTIDEIHDNGGLELIGTNKVLKCGISENKLRFTSTSYGKLPKAPTVHNNEHRVILKINTRYLPLTKIEMDILREIVGPNRLNDSRQELRLTTNTFGSRIENKRHLVYMLDRIVLSCQRLGSELEKETAEQQQQLSSSSSSNEVKQDTTTAAVTE